MRRGDGCILTTRKELQQKLCKLDGRGYSAYKDLCGSYDFGGMQLFIDHVQGDPFAAPSRLRLRIEQSLAGYPKAVFANQSRTRGLCTYLATAFADAATRRFKRRGSGKSGLIKIDTPGQSVLERTCVQVTTAYIEARFAVGLPAKGRKISGQAVVELLCEDIIAVAEKSLLHRNNDVDLIERYVETTEDTDALRRQLVDRDLVAFVADGSLLPRQSGLDDRPLDTGGIPFCSPSSLRVELERPNAGRITGMGVPRGVTLIVGGGFHGKSTLLTAMERGIYNHIPGDGREYVVADTMTVTIRAENGRRVNGVDISPFVTDLPLQQDTGAFCTENASGSTSQAANIMEALEVGARVLLIDEDTAATNFMIRDRRMQELVTREPLTPLIDRVRQLYDEQGVSTVVAIGGSGDYFDVADTIIALEDYRPWDATRKGRAIARLHPTERLSIAPDAFRVFRPRVPEQGSMDPGTGRLGVRSNIRGAKAFHYSDQVVDLSAVGQLIDDSQTRALAAALLYTYQHYIDGVRTVEEVVRAVAGDIEKNSLDVLDEGCNSDLAVFRTLDLAAALNRFPTLRARPVDIVS